ncbi:MAG: HNH endonuclease [Planctomycetaceae bacterium]|nr:HNH endonuclease [Planctomycetaceae bacterium]
MRLRANHCCEYCRVPSRFDLLPFHVEHVISKKHHGRSVLSNLALSCPACNLFKAANIAGMDPESGELTRLFHPRSDGWDDHFQWNGAVLVGKTAVGRTTIDVLEMNQPERVRHRELLIQLGGFPPQVAG